jgi:hypothetical protein
MAKQSRYCEYNCDYMCNVCLAKEMEAEKNGQGIPKIPESNYNPLADDDDERYLGWMGYGSPQITVDDHGELTGFPLTRYSPTGGHHQAPAKPYVPEPMKLLKEGEVLQIDEEPVLPDSPDELIIGEIIT